MASFYCIIYSRIIIAGGRRLMKTISKEQFIKAIEFINAQNEKQESFIAALELLSPGTYCDCLLYSSYESFVVKLLMELLEDDKEDINYYLYENKECVVLVDGEKKVLYNSPETLYNYLVEKKK